MAKLHEILASLRDELIAEIEAIEPNRYIDPRCEFHEFKGTDEDVDNPRDTRSFSIDNPAFDSDELIGATTSHPWYKIEISFYYPDTIDWRQAAADDMDQIKWYFGTTPSSVSGVCARFPSVSGNVSDRETNDGLGRLWTITLHCQFEITH